MGKGFIWILAVLTAWAPTSFGRPFRLSFSPAAYAGTMQDCAKPCPECRHGKDKTPPSKEKSCCTGMAVCAALSAFPLGVPPAVGQAVAPLRFSQAFAFRDERAASLSSPPAVRPPELLS
jgi:hypothetical protein